MSKFLHISLVLLLAIGIQSCRTGGCTDPKANNFSYEAKLDDGSCNYGGCTDENALNFNPDAKEDNGTCKYNGGLKFISTRSQIENANTFLSVEMDGAYIGKIQNNCNKSFQDCNTICDHVSFTNQAEGTYSFSFYEIRIISATQIDTLFTSEPLPVYVIGGKCSVSIID